MLPHEWLGRAGERTVGTVRGPAPYTTTLMVGAMLAVAFLRRDEASSRRIALFGIVAIAFVGIAISFSRGSWVGAAFVLLGLFLFRRKVALRLAVVLLVLVAALAVLSGGITAYVSDRLSDDDTAESRLVTNNAAIRMIQLRPLLGFGYGNFELYDESLKVRVDNMPAQEGSSHHTFLHLAAENGVPALVLYLVPVAWLLFLTLRRWRQVTSRDPLNAPLLIAMWLALAHQFVVMNFMDMMDSSPWGTALWWLCLGGDPGRSDARLPAGRDGTRRVDGPSQPAPVNEAAPIFVAGLDHSGKTALRAALGAHPSIHMVRHIELWTRLRRWHAAGPSGRRRALDALTSGASGKAWTRSRGGSTDPAQRLHRAGTRDRPAALRGRRDEPMGPPGGASSSSRRHTSCARCPTLGSFISCATRGTAITRCA